MTHKHHGESDTEQINRGIAVIFRKGLDRVGAYRTLVLIGIFLFPSAKENLGRILYPDKTPEQTHAIRQEVNELTNEVNSINIKLDVLRLDVAEIKGRLDGKHHLSDVRPMSPGVPEN